MYCAPELSRAYMLEKSVKEISTVKIPSPAIEDNSAVRMGSFTPAFPPVRAEPAKVADKGTIRMGSFSPPFPAAPAM
jgi:hypothetical protein